jgi:protein-S-isoprenylcysteine O-methyltransferase
MDLSNGSANGTAHQPFPDNNQNTSWSPPRNPRPNPFDLINNGGIGHRQPANMSYSPQEKEASETSIPAALELYDKQYLPSQPKSLSGIAARSFLLGISLAFSSTLAIYLLQPSSYTPLWRTPFFIAVLSLFHYLEFWTTAAYNTREAKISSFLLSSNGVAYQGAHTFALVELLVEHYFWPTTPWLPPFVSLPLLFTGLVLIVSGQIIRSMAMRAAGTNFNHIVQSTKRSTHTLVTTGIYRYLRHPSYFGFFWWALGTQLVLGNFLAFLVYWAVLYKFFRARIDGEEEYLVGFFGEDYVRFRERTGVWIPFIR